MLQRYRNTPRFGKTKGSEPSLTLTFMRTKKLTFWKFFLIAFVAIQFLDRLVLPLLWSGLGMLGLPVWAQGLLKLVLPSIIIFETVGRLLLLRALKFSHYEPTQIADWPQLNAEALVYYTDELQKLGFTVLGDYTAPTIKGMMRLHVQPDLACLAEVGQIEGQQIFCTVSSYLEDNWFLAATNLSGTPIALGVGYGFMRLPRQLHRRLPNAKPAVLLETLLDWRTQITTELSVQPLPDPSPEMYFAASLNSFAQRRHRLWRSSIIWRMIEALLFALNPKSTWLGDYPKYKKR
jgi:hypothetical protein